MGIFSAIMDKLRGRSGAQASTAGTQQNTAAAGNAPTPGGGSTSAPSTGAQSQATLQNVDVDAVLSQMAQQKGGGGNYRQSIVDLLKLLDLDSSLNARKELAEELNVKAGEHGSAEQNIALHRAVMRKLAENGGKVPESLRS